MSFRVRVPKNEKDIISPRFVQTKIDEYLQVGIGEIHFVKAVLPHVQQGPYGQRTECTGTNRLYHMSVQGGFRIRKTNLALTMGAASHTVSD